MENSNFPHETDHILAFVSPGFPLHPEWADATAEQPSDTDLPARVHQEDSVLPGAPRALLEDV